MLGDLFDEESQSSSGNSVSSKRTSAKDRPEAARNSCNLCGLKNQGATCYLNTLIQTLFLTPEFRDRLFSLSPDELGLVPSTLANAKVRVIPIELQRLFANLMLLDQDSCSTTRLTNSFGWSNNESFQQHDVQELNRILFTAIESSLVNTKEAQLIQQLYRGTIMNKIHCLSCDNIKQREEEFLDLPIAVQGFNDLQVSLMNSFIAREQLNGSNQYFCEICNKLCDAEKYCQLKSLPDILTLSLLRFTYDMKTWQRIKVLEKFEFPFELDLNAFLEDEFKKSVSEDYTKYELYSVIIHSGSAYGGHYHTYIKDVQKIGKWEPNGAKEVVKKEKKGARNTKKQVTIIEPTESDIKPIVQQQQLNQKEIHLVRENLEDSELDYLKYMDPKELLKAFLYEKYQYKSTRIDNMCAELLKVTGMSWNKTFKGRCGPINKFLKKHDDAFDLVENELSVKLRKHDEIHEILSRNYDEFCAQKKLDSEFTEKCIIEEPVKMETTSEVITESTENEVLNDEHGQWFDFNDCNIRPIRSSTIKTQFEGKESAYMLFYRRKNLKADSKALISEWLLNEVNTENKTLRESRQTFDSSNNEITLNVTLDIDIYLKEPLNIINILDEKNIIPLKIDKRLKISELSNQLVQHLTSINEISRKEIAINYLLSNQDSLRYLTLKRTPNGLFASGYLSGDAEISILNRDKFHSILVTANLDKYSVGDENAPVMLKIKYFDKELNYREVNEVVTRAASLQHLKEILCRYRVGSEKNFSLISVKKDSKSEEVDQKWQLDFFDYSNNAKRLSEYSIKNGDFVIVENENFDMNFANIAPKTTTASSTQTSIKVRIVNCVNQSDASDSLPFNDLQVGREDSFEQTKIAALSVFLLDAVKYDSCHLRFVNLETASSSFPQLVTDLSAELKQNNKKILTGLRLNESQTLSEFLFKVQKEPIDEISELQSIVFVLCDGRAHLPSIKEIAVKFHLQLDVKHFSDEVKCELLFAKDLKVREVVSLAREAMKLAPEMSFYLKTVNWMGEPDKILNCIDKTCEECGIDDDTSFLCLVKGDLIADGYVKLNMWLYKLVAGVQHEINDDLLKNKLYYSVDSITSGEFDFLESFIVSNETKLEDFRTKISDFLIENSQLVTQLVNNCCWLSDEGVKFRLRLMRKNMVKGKGSSRKHNFEIMKMRKALFEEHKSLRQMNFQSSEVDIAIEVLAEEEINLNQGIMLVDCLEFDLGEKRFKSVKEICWNINNGATVNSLKQSIIKEFGLEANMAFHLSIAKRQHEKYDWILLKDLSVGEDAAPVKTTAKGKGKKGAAAQQKQGAKTNLRSAPFNLDDGDVIAFLVDSLSSASAVSNKEFLTPLDIELKKQQTKVKASFDLFESGNEGKSSKRKASNRRAEVGITIITDDFN